MGSSRDRGRGGLGWWCALPDTEATAPAAALLCGAGDVLARHPCGRLWIIGQYQSPAVHLLDIGPTRVAVLGECLAAVNRLAAKTNGSVEALMTALLSLPGSFHTVITGPVGLVAAGDVAGFRRLFTANLNGIALITSHADVLRRLLGAPVNRTWLATKLASPATKRAARHAESFHRSDTGPAWSPHPDHRSQVPYLPLVESPEADTTARGGRRGAL